MTGSSFCIETETFYIWLIKNMVIKKVRALQVLFGKWNLF